MVLIASHRSSHNGGRSNTVCVIASCLSLNNFDLPCITNRLIKRLVSMSLRYWFRLGPLPSLELDHFTMRNGIFSHGLDNG